MAVSGLEVLGVVLSLAWIAGCGAYGTGVDDENGTAGPATLSGGVQPIFSTSCALSGCHTGGGQSLPGAMNLGSGQSFANTVNVPALETAATTGLMRILPGQPDSSYLVHKIEGTHLDVGGSGSRMPLSGCCLSSSQIKTIRDWIAAGAQRN